MASVKAALRASGLGSLVDLGGRVRRMAHKSSSMEARDAQDMRNLALLMRFWLRNDSNCIDVGANAGDVLRDMLTLAPDGHHIAFEPLPHRVDSLREQFGAAEVRQLALSDHTGTSEFTHVPDCDGYSGFRPQWYPRPWSTETIVVAVDTLDRSLPAGYQPALVKIDVEGAEREVIAGGMGTLRTARPIVVFEHFQGGAGDGYGYGPAEIFPLLVNDADMEIFDIDGVGPYSLPQMEDVFVGRRLWTWVARPK